MSYRKVFNNPYPEGWVDLPNEDTSISAAALQAHTDAIEKMDSYLEKIGKAEDAGYIQMNMFNMSTVYLGKKLGDEGELVDDPGSMTTDFIEIDDKLQYMLSALNDSECLVKVHAYNSDFEWMMLCAMQTFYDNVVFPFAVVNGAKYIKVSLSKDAKEVVLEDGYITHPYLPSNKELAAELSEQKESLTQYEQDGFLSRNLVCEVIKANIINTSGKINSGEYTTAIFYGKGGQKVTVSADSINRSIIWRYSEKPYIGMASGAEAVNITTGVTTVTLPSDGWYAWYISTTVTDNVQVEYGEVAHAYTPYAMSNTGLTKLVDEAKEDGFLLGKNKILYRIKSAQILGEGKIETVSNWDLVVARVEQGKTYALTTDDRQYYELAFYTDKPQLNSVSYNRQRRIEAVTTVVAPITGYIALRCTPSYATPMIEEGSTVTTYEAPNPSNAELKQSLAQLSDLTTLQVSGNGTDAIVANGSYAMGKLCFVNLYITGVVTTKGAWTVIASLPTTHKAFKTTYSLGNINNNATIIEAVINENENTISIRSQSDLNNAPIKIAFVFLAK